MMKRAAAFALFLALGSAPALAQAHVGGISPAAHISISPAIMTMTSSDFGKRIHGGGGGNLPQALSPSAAPSLFFDSRPIQCETTVYTDRNGFFVPQEMTYAALGSCPLLPVTFIDDIAPLPPTIHAAQALVPLLLPADDFDLANW
jgi:hypothetical protein